METEVRHFHLDDDLAAQIPLEAGDDAGHVAWEDLTPEMRLYASHKDWVYHVVELPTANRSTVMGGAMGSRSLI